MGGRVREGREGLGGRPEAGLRALATRMITSL